MPTIALVGDVMLGRGVNAALPRRSPESFWGSTLPVLRSADAVFANLECAITGHRQPWRRSPKVFHFRADPAAIGVLKAGNIRYLSLANNHTLDFEVDGLRDTLHHLDDAGIAHAGAGCTLANARTPALVDVAGLRIGVISATDNEPAFGAGPGRPGTNYWELDDERVAMAELTTAAAELRSRGAGIVVLSLHWGPNMVVSPPPHFQEFAGAAVGGGVDLLHGHSAHVFQGIQRGKPGLILYDTGDFLDDYAVDPQLRNDWSFVFLLDFTEAGDLDRVRLVPVALGYARVDLATGADFREICERMKSRCAPFATPLTDIPEGLEIQP